jgi:hypothetical protein
MARILTEETSLTRKRKGLEQENRVLSKLLPYELGLALVTLVAGVAIYIWRGSTVPIWIGLLFGVTYVAHRLRIRQNSREEKIVQAGLRGEIEVTRQLSEALDRQHYIFNDLKILHGRKSAQIDHLIVSPKGIFAIETKNWRGHIEGSATDDRWRQIKEPGHPPIKVFNPIRQTQRHAELLRGALAAAGIDWPHIYSLVVFLSPRTTFAVPDSTIPVVRPGEAVQYIARFPAERDYTEQEISDVVHFLMRSK